MLSKGPHISIEAATLVPRILRISEKDFTAWPDSVRALTIAVAEELFLAIYNPYIPEDMVKKSVSEHFEMFRRGLAHHYATSISEGITMFWSAYESDKAFRADVLARLKEFLPADAIDLSRHARVANATDATDLRLELPLFVVTPKTEEQVSAIVKLANEMQFALIPRGGGSGLTGGSIPARKRSVVLSLSKFTKLGPVDKVNKTVHTEAGVLTINVINYAKEHGFFFAVDPASKTASSIGGNIAENAGGPVCFEYGTTIDNLLSYRMVTPTGEIIEVTRKDHPRHKILPDETAVFEVRDLSGGLRSIVTLTGDDLRKRGLGKDVTNKKLGGLPGLQKEGTDGIIVGGTFILHDQLEQTRVMVLEFFGRSMENSTHVITEIVALRDAIRKAGDLVKITALEEFNAKYVQAINYQRKSRRYEGDPISVLILQLESDHEKALDAAVKDIGDICDNHDGVDSFVAQDEAEAELFWEDRHRLSAIAKRTSGFKINEDVVIPIHSVPAYALFLEQINLEYMARAYRWALKQAGNLPGLAEEDPRIVEEIAYATRIIQKEITPVELSDQELQLHSVIVLRSLVEDYPDLTKEIGEIEKNMLNACIVVASHMHAGDGNCHVNIPVNSNDPAMLRNAETVAHLVMAKAQELGGEVTGEHGIGITKIAFLSEEKLKDFNEYKQLVDPRNIMNPAKLTQRELPVAPFTFSFNRLIEDIRQSGLLDKERLIAMLANVQVCTRCGKCKQFCPMFYPEQSLLYHPRNKNMAIGALIEAIYYTQVNMGKTDPFLLSELRGIMEHCTGCGKCMAVCPVKIASADVALTFRSYLEEEGAGGHPLKARALKTVAKDVAKRVPLAGKAASIGQGVQNRLVGSIPRSWRKRFSNPLFSGLGPKPGYANIYESLAIGKGSLFVPEGKVKGTALYFPGCGGGVFFRNISLAGISLMLRAGYAVLLPEKHLCCGYPLLAAGEQEDFLKNQAHNLHHLQEITQKASAVGFPVSVVLTACGSCREGLERHLINTLLRVEGQPDLRVDDLSAFVMESIGPCSGEQSCGKHTNQGKGKPQGDEPIVPANENAPAKKLSEFLLPPSRSASCTTCVSTGTDCKAGQQVIFHAPCHSERPNVKKIVAGKLFAQAIEKTTGANVTVSPGCCGESGLGAMTSPQIYNVIRSRKAAQLEKDFALAGAEAAVIVSCPSCKMGLSRIFMNKGEKRRVLHVLEYLAEHVFGIKSRRKCQKLLSATPCSEGVRRVAIDKLPSIPVSEKEGHENDDI